MLGCSEDLLARPRTEDIRSSWAPRPPRGKSPDRRQRVPGAAAPPPAAAASEPPAETPAGRADERGAGSRHGHRDAGSAAGAPTERGSLSGHPLLPGGAAQDTPERGVPPAALRGHSKACRGGTRCLPDSGVQDKRARALLLPAPAGLQVPPGPQNYLGWKSPLRSSSSAFGRTPPCQADHVTKCRVQSFLKRL